MSARVLAGTVSLMTRGQLRVLNTLRSNGFRTASGVVLADGSASIDAGRGPRVQVDAGGHVTNAHELADTPGLWAALGYPAPLPAAPTCVTGFAA